MTDSFNRDPLLSMRPPSDPYVGRTLARRFELVRRLGGGGMGAVYVATDRTLGRSAAVKILYPQHGLDPDLVTRFMREARTTANLRHPNLVECSDFGQDQDGTLFLVLEFLKGRDLAEELSSVGRLPFERALRIMKQLTTAVAYAHQAGVIHRDLKPANVFLVDGPEELVKVLDFGISKLTDEMVTRHTKTGQVMGTPGYMAPEQYLDASKVDVRCDVYALGVILFEMLAGRSPYQAESLPELVLRMQTEHPVDLRAACPGLPQGLPTAVRKAMARRPENRYPTAAAFGEALDAIARKGDTSWVRSAEAMPEELDVTAPAPVPKTMVRATEGVGSVSIPPAPSPTPVSATPAAGTAPPRVRWELLLLSAVVVAAVAWVSQGLTAPTLFAHAIAIQLRVPRAERPVARVEAPPQPRAESPDAGGESTASTAAEHNARVHPTVTAPVPPGAGARTAEPGTTAGSSPSVPPATPATTSGSEGVGPRVGNPERQPTL